MAIMQTWKIDEFFWGIMMGILVVLVFLFPLFAAVDTMYQGKDEVYRKIKQEAVERGYATWGETTDGEQVFVWKE